MPNTCSDMSLFSSSSRGQGTLVVPIRFSLIPVTSLKQARPLAAFRPTFLDSGFILPRERSWNESISTKIIIHECFFRSPDRNRTGCFMASPASPQPTIYPSGRPGGQDFSGARFMINGENSGRGELRGEAVFTQSAEFRRAGCAPRTRLEQSLRRCK